MYKLNGYAVIFTDNDGVVISYTMKDVDSSGNIIRNNLRKSMQVKTTDTDTLNNVQSIKTFIENTENQASS